MSFQIVKGWPEGALDITLPPNAATPAAVGQIGWVGADWVPANYEALGADAAKQAAFIYDKDAMTTKMVGLVGAAILVVDADHYAADVYAINDKLTAIGGVFAKPTNLEPVIAKVLAVDAASGKLTILWAGPNLN